MLKKRLPKEVFFALFFFVFRESLTDGIDVCNDENCSEMLPKKSSDLFPNAHYNKNHHPFFSKGNKTIVENTIMVMAAFEINEINNDLSLLMWHELSWEDPRLGEARISLKKETYNLLWRPRTIFYLTKESKIFYFSEKSTTFSINNTTCSFWTLYKMIFYCSMSFVYFPFDVQICQIYQESTELSDVDLLLTWSKYNITNSIGHDEFWIHIEPLKPLNSKYSFGVRYSVLPFRITLRRKYLGYMFSHFLPSVMFLGVSWLSLLLPLHQVQPRITLSITTLLTITTNAVAIRSELALSPLIRATDVWNMACLTFVSIVLITVVYSCRGNCLNHNPAELDEWKKKMRKWNKFIAIALPSTFLMFAFIFIVFIGIKTGRI